MDASTKQDFIVRHAVPDDVPALDQAIATIDEETEFLAKPGEYRQRWAPGFAGRLKEMNEKNTGAYAIALNGGEIVGFLGAFAGVIKRARGIVYIAHVGVRAAWRGRGVGTALFEAIEAWARGQNAWRLDLRVDTQNARGLALYQKRGFVIEGRIVDGAGTHGVWRDHFLMAKALRVLSEPPWEPLELPLSGQGADGPVSFRPLRAEDAGRLRAFQLGLAGETPFLLLQPGDVPDEPTLVATVARGLQEPGRLDVVAVVPAADGQRIVGHALAEREEAARMRHNAYVSVHVRRSHWRRGIARRLAAEVEAWAREQGLRRLTGLVQAHNTRALRFATAAGFKEELVSPRYAVIEGRAVDRVRVVRFL
ncbi:MAG TPA: GNAT family N-acetyltransferase [Xanthobacteraceae bacterium]|jgi:RimJ/RimL family protein N-acetyltransferase|nr:GNAT family N-acetyltransferase [Xanthobacteraceae bacterium]